MVVKSAGFAFSDLVPALSLLYLNTSKLQYCHESNGNDATYFLGLYMETCTMDSISTKQGCDHLSGRLRKT